MHTELRWGHPFWELRETGLPDSSIQSESAEPGLDLAHNISSVANPTLPGILGLCHGLAWGSGDLGHVPALLVFCNVALASPVPSPAVASSIKLLG